MKSTSGWTNKIAIVGICVLLLGATIMLTDLSGLTVTGTETYTDPDELTISNSTVEPGGDLTLKAGNIVRLKPGFHAKPGSRLTAQVDPDLHDFQLSSLPPTTGNDRFYNEVFSQIKRPGLSIIGFDNGGDHSKGYGLKQILEQVYITGTNEQKEFFKKVLDISQEDITLNPSNDNVVEENSNKLQYRAFEALCSFVLEKNGISSQTSSQTYGIPIRGHEMVINSFTSDIMALVPNDNLTDPGDDYVKNVETYMNIARAIDLYLALENAYTKWPGVSGNTSWLLTQSEKQQLMERFIGDLQSLYDNHVHKNHFLGVNEDEVEPGNRPLKGHMAIGYSVLAIQNASGWDGVDHRLGTARWRASSPTSTNRKENWMYQTDNGKRYWAEGPYYLNFALVDAVPFWHALRANNLLDDVSDPFRNAWFLNPTEWLADVSTPDGLTPPLDDGNKHRISAAPMLRWSSEYGNAEVGKKFNYIYKVTNEYRQPGTSAYFFNNNTYLTELAIPKAVTEKLIDYDVKDSGEQQVIARHRDGNNNMHYLLLNGEYGNAIKRGEIHEQPDQLQLLYYVNGTSYLMDRGYDSPGGFGASSYNFYRAHNIMSYTNFHGGIENPFISLADKRAISDHQFVDALYLTSPSTQVKNLFSSISLDLPNIGLGGQYSRNVLFVEGDKPYLIDINSIFTSVHDPGKYNENIQNYQEDVIEELFYHGNSDTFLGTTDWYNWDTNSSTKDMHIFLRPVEFNETNISSDIVGEMEKFGDFNTITQGSLTFHTPIPRPLSDTYNESNPYQRYFNTIAFLHVADSQPTVPKKIFPYLANKKTPHQGWYWQHDVNTIDVIVKRSKVDMTQYSQDLNFYIDGDGDGDVFIAGLILPASLDYGFARFNKDTDDVWWIDPDYQINLEQDFSITASSTACASSIASVMGSAMLSCSSGAAAVSWSVVSALQPASTRPRIINAALIFIVLPL